MLRKLIASQLPSYELSGEVEADESYFGGVRKGKRGRGAAGKVAVFGLFNWGEKVFTVVVPNAKAETLWPIIEEKVTPDSIVFTDSFKAYNASTPQPSGMCESITPRASPTEETTSMALKISGTKPSDTLVDSKESSLQISTGSSRSANGVSTETVIKTF